MTSLLVMIVVLVVISLALDVMILAVIGNLISRSSVHTIHREVARVMANAMVRTAEETQTEMMSRRPHYDA